MASQRLASQHAAENTPAEPKKFSVNLAQDEATDGLPIHVKQGDQVIIRITTGEQSEADFQIEGYQQSTNVERGNLSQFEFEASRKGTFNVVLSRREPWEGEVMRKKIGDFVVE
jgi:exosome complex RNA-binding protein Csl4